MQEPKKRSFVDLRISVYSRMIFAFRLLTLDCQIAQTLPSEMANMPTCQHAIVVEVVVWAGWRPKSSGLKTKKILMIFSQFWAKIMGQIWLK